LSCGITDESDIPDSFPHKGKMNIRYARGGSSINTTITSQTVYVDVAC